MRLQIVNRTAAGWMHMRVVMYQVTVQLCRSLRSAHTVLLAVSSWSRICHERCSAWIVCTPAAVALLSSD